MAREIINYAQSVFSVTTTNQIMVKEKKAGQDIRIYNNHASAVTYLNTSGKAGHALDFTSGGTTEIEVDDEVEGESGGATGNVVKVDLDSGTWAGADAAGTIWIDTLTGTFQSETLKVGASLNLATIAAVQDVTRSVRISAGGSLELLNAVNEIYVIGSAAHKLVVFTGIKSGGHS